MTAKHATHDQVPALKATCTQIASEITASVTNYKLTTTQKYEIINCTHITLNEQGIY